MSISRRARLDQLTAEEKAIQALSGSVEKLGADPLLTEVITLLGEAGERLADFVDAKLAKRSGSFSELIHSDQLQVLYIYSTHTPSNAMVFIDAKHQDVIDGGRDVAERLEDHIVNVTEDDYTSLAKVADLSLRHYFVILHRNRCLVADIDWMKRTLPAGRVVIEYVSPELMAVLGEPAVPKTPPETAPWSPAPHAMIWGVLSEAGWLIVKDTFQKGFVGSVSKGDGGYGGGWISLFDRDGAWHWTAWAGTQPSARHLVSRSTIQGLDRALSMIDDLMEDQGLKWRDDAVERCTECEKPVTEHNYDCTQHPEPR